MDAAAAGFGGCGSLAEILQTKNYIGKELPTYLYLFDIIDD